MFHLRSNIRYLKTRVFQMSKKLAVFDFDHTIIDENSDIVVRDIVPKEEIPASVKQLYKSDGWTAYMQGVFDVLHNKEISENKIQQTIEEIQPLKGMDTLITRLNKDLNYDVIIVSDSNSYFIETWLKKHNMEDYVTQVFTNPAYFHDKRLKIDMYHLQTECSLSTKNLCKGRILEEFVESQRAKGVIYDRVIYAGDGYNDFCPMLRLKKGDLACAREDYKCADLVRLTLLNQPIDTGATYNLKCDTVFWKSGYDILDKVL